VGTTFLYQDEADAKSGRILILSVKDEKFRLKSEITVRGAVNTIVPFHGKLLAGISSRVQLFKFKIEGSTHTLEMECELRGSIVIVDIAVRDEFVLVADVMKSVTLLLYSP